MRPLALRPGTDAPPAPPRYATVNRDSGETEDLQIIFILVFFSIVLDDLNESTNTFPRVQINYQQNQLPCSKTGAASTSHAVCCWRSTITDRRWALSPQSGPEFVLSFEVRSLQNISLSSSWKQNYFVNTYIEIHGWPPNKLTTWELIANSTAREPNPNL